MKDALCEAFCNNLKVNEVPVGLAVSTGFKREDGDAISFYVVYVDGRKSARLEDDGDTIPYIEACGVDLGTRTRAKAFQALLAEYGAEYDSEEGVITTKAMSVEALPKAALRFVALLLRVRDLLLMTEERVAGTFRDDVVKAVQNHFAERAIIELNVPLTAGLENFPVDVVIRASGHQPVALYIGTAENRVLEAMLLRMETQHDAPFPCRVALILEQLAGHGIKATSIQRALNKLDYVGSFKGTERDVVERLEREVFESPAVH